MAETLNNEKASITGPAKGLLKVTEDNIRVLLDAAMEQPDRELLLQRHFTSLLTSVWRITSCRDKQKSCLIPQNNLNQGIRLFGASVNMTSQNANKGPSVKNFNVRECSDLITRALHDTESVSLNKVASTSNGMEVDSPTIEKLNVTLEFGGMRDETNDATVGFPSVVSVSIPSLDPLSTLMVPSEETQLRSSQNLPESRFRASLSACLHGALGWAPSAFPVSESKSRSAFKSPALGKHKLTPTDSGSRSTKSKTRKIVAESYVIHPPFEELLQQSLFTNNLNDLILTSGSQPLGIPNDSFEGHLIDSPSGSDVEILSEMSTLDMVSHCYDPSFISDLDDCSSLPEYTDMG